MDDIAGLDELYRLPPEEFVAARDALVKDLRQQGDKEQAAAVKALRRPSVPAWALNQVREHAAGELDAFFAVATDLAAVQRGRGTGGELRELFGRYRAAQAEVVRAALACLREAGRDPEPQRPAIESTVAAAGGDPEIGEMLRAGRLTREEAGASLGFLSLAGGTDVGPGSKRSSPSPSTSPSSSQKQDKAKPSAEEESDDAERAIAAAQEDVALAQRTVVREQARVGRAREQLERAHFRLSDLRARLEEAEAKHAAEQAEYDDRVRDEAAAQEALDRARAKLEKLEKLEQEP